MLNIVVPMAGRGSRFANVGYKNPKPLIEINGFPMIRLVIKNLKPSVNHRFIFICQKKHIQEFNLEDKLRSWAGPNTVLIPVENITEGAACTVLLAKDYINNSDPLMIANSDQWMDVDINDYLSTLSQSKSEGLIMTMTASDPKWSYIGLLNGKITEVVEKKVISNEATVGIYNFAMGKLFVTAAEEMIRKNLRVNNEFYVAPTYNELISKGANIQFYNIGKELDGMYGLGTPEDLTLFLNNPICNKALSSLKGK